MTDHDSEVPGVPQPDPALKRLNRLVGYPPFTDIIY